MKKKWLLFLLILAIIIGILPLLATETQAATDVTVASINSNLANLKQKLCSGSAKYWNAGLSENQLKAIVDNGILNQANPSNAQLGVTTSGCGNKCTSNCYDGWQCFGFARWVQYVLFRTAISDNSANFETHTITSGNAATFVLQPGDLLEVGTGNVHSAIVASVNGEQFECLEAWGSVGCKIVYSTGGFNCYYNTLSKVLAKYPGYQVRVYRYKYIKTEPSYLSQCSTLYPSYGEATVKTACNPHPLPCSHGVALQYGTESRPMTDKALSPGDKFTINGIIKNTEGHYWYKVTLKDGTQGYVYAEECKTMTRLNPSVSGSITPDSMNGATYLGRYRSSQWRKT